jgi:hypothetical protein
MMLEIFGRRGGLCGGKGGSMHIADLDHGMLGANAIVGGAPILAIGAALTAKVKDNKSVAISFTGDGGSNQGTVLEAMNMAVVLKLPCVFIFENNGYGEATGVSYAVGTPSIANRAAAFGMPAVTVDGTDFFAVYEAARDSIARQMASPSAIEAKAASSIVIKTTRSGRAATGLSSPFDGLPGPVPDPLPSKAAEFRAVDRHRYGGSGSDRAAVAAGPRRHHRRTIF